MNFIIPFPPATGNHMWKHAGGKHYLVEKVREYYGQVAFAVRQQGTQAGLREAIAVELRVYPPDRRKRDLSNICKVVEDSLTRAGVWEDDSLIERLTLRRMPVAAGGRIEVFVESVDKIAH